MTRSLILFLIALIIINNCTELAKKKDKKSKKKSKKNSRCITKHTRWNISGFKDDELKYFDRHQVNCPKNRLLTFVKLQLDKKLSHEKAKTNVITKMRFKYTCCKTRVYSCRWIKTKPVKTGNAYTLNKLAPACKCNKVLKGFKIVTKFKQPGLRFPKTHIKYECCSFHYKRLKKFKTMKMSTQWNDSGKGRTKFLSRHKIRCGNNSFMGGFRLMLQDKNIKTNPSTRFDYTCVHPIFKKKNVRKIVRRIETVKNRAQNRPIEGPRRPSDRRGPPRDNDSRNRGPENDQGNRSYDPRQDQRQSSYDPRQDQRQGGMSGPRY